MGIRRSLFKTRVGTNELILYLHCILVYNIICKPCTQILSHSYNSYIHMIKYVCILIYIRHVCCCPLGSKRHELHLHPGLTWWCLPNLLPTTRCSDSWASVASVYPGRVWRISMFEEFILWFAMINHFVHPHGIGWNTMIWLACFFVFFRRDFLLISYKQFKRMHVYPTSELPAFPQVSGWRTYRRRRVCRLREARQRDLMDVMDSPWWNDRIDYGTLSKLSTRWCDQSGSWGWMMG